MSIINLDQLVAAFNTSQLLQVNKASIVTQGAGGYSALWRGTGIPGQGAIPGAAAVIDNSLTGAITFAQPTGGMSTYGARLSMVPGNANTEFLLYDRLAHMGGLSGVTTGNQTVGVDVSGSSLNLVNRRGASDYSDVTWWWEIYTDIGVTAQTCTVTYTNGGGTGSRTTTFSLGGASPLNQDSRTFQIIGTAGEYIQSIQTVSIATSTGTAGSWGITARRLLTSVTLPLASNSIMYDWMQLGLPRVHDSACLEMVLICGTTSTGTMIGSLRLVQG